MKDIDLLLHHVMTEAPACPEPRAIRALRGAANEFCERTRLWKENIEVTVTVSEDEVLAPVSSDALIYEIRAAQIDTTELKPKTAEWLDTEYPGWSFDETEGSANYITQIHPNIIKLYPRVAGTLKARLILRPAETATTLPDFLIDMHGERIGKGAAGKLLMSTNTTYANPQAGGAFTKTFEGWLDTLAYESAKGQQGGRLRSRSHFI
jgi:hypothetical protein